jgi:hypothetical protein
MHNGRRMMDLATEVLQHSAGTACFGWDKSGDQLLLDPTNVGARPITKADWLRALKVACDVFVVRRDLGVPECGADATGAVDGKGGACLVWRDGSDKAFVLWLRPNNGFAWDRLDARGLAQGTSPDLRDAIQALESTFVRKSA